jgi:hypothetical protein
MAGRDFSKDKGFLEDNQDLFLGGMVRPTRVFDMNILSPATVPTIGASSNGAAEKENMSVDAYGPIDGPMSGNVPQTDNIGPTTHGGSGGMGDQGLGF